VLRRRLVLFGVNNLVVRPRNWDEYGKRLKTDRRHALALVSCLDRYVAGSFLAKMSCVECVRETLRLALEAVEAAFRGVQPRGTCHVIGGKFY